MKLFKKIISVLAAFAVIAAASGCGVIDTVMDKINNTAEPASEPEQTETAETEETAETQIEESNSIKLGIIDFDTFNPLLTQSETLKEAMQFVYEPLFDVDENLCPVGVLAENYNVSPDGLTIDIKLRDGILWQDGSAFTAADASYTIAQVMAGLTTYTKNTEDIKDCFDYNGNCIRVTLKYALPNFVAMLNFPIIKYRSDMTMSQDFIPVGTGAYRYESRPEANKTEFTAFEEYHGGRAAIDKMYMCSVPDIAKYESMFDASELDVISGEAADLSEYTPRGNSKRTDYVSNKMVYLGYNLMCPVFKGESTRRGAARLIDKDEIISSVIYTRGVAADVPINPKSIYYYDTKTRFKRDEGEAMAHFTEDEWVKIDSGALVRTVNGREQTLTFGILVDEDVPHMSAVAQKISEQMRRSGVIAEVVTAPHEEYEKRIADGNFDAYLGEIIVPPNGDLTELVTSAGNVLAYGNAALDTLIGQMGMTQDEEGLKSLYSRYGDIILSDMPFTVIYFRKSSLHTGAKIQVSAQPSVLRCYKDVNTWSIR